MVTNAQRKKTEQGPTIQDLPIGIAMSGKRKESDSLGEVEVPADHYWWRAQTRRSLIHLDWRRPHAKGGLSRLWLHKKGGSPSERKYRAPATMESRFNRKSCR